MATINDSLSDEAILAELGRRLRALRLRRNKPIETLASEAVLSPRTVLALERGRGKLENFVAVLRALRAVDNLDALLPEPTTSPLDVARRQGKVRQRAYRRAATGKARPRKEPEQW